MSKNKLKGEMLYQQLKAERERLVKKYEAGGSVRYDVAVGLRAADGSLRTKTVNDYDTDSSGEIVVSGTRVVPDFDAIKAANIADGIPSGKMIDALKKRAEGKTVLLYKDDEALKYGTILLGEVQCQIKLMDDLVNVQRTGIAPGFKADAGLVHALPGMVEANAVKLRGERKPFLFRGDAENLNNPVSLWADQDKTRTSMHLFAVNSEIMMYGQYQVIDLNGKTIGAHERPNRVASFSSIVDLSDGIFDVDTTTRSASNCHIYSSTGHARMARSNHFTVRGHFNKNVLLENFTTGSMEHFNWNTYFGSFIFNDSSQIVVKDIHQESSNKAVANSSTGLAWYSQLIQPQYILGTFERASTWSQMSAAYPYLKWEDKASSDPDTFQNGKTTLFPVVKTSAELQAEGVSQAAADKIVAALDVMQAALKKSMKAADDTLLSVDSVKGIIGIQNPMDSLQRMNKVTQIPRSVNLIVQNPRTSQNLRYPDGVAYGFRVGSSGPGVQKLALDRHGTSVQDIYVMDCTFDNSDLSLQESPNLAIEGVGLLKGFNGFHLRPFGISNSMGHAANAAPALILQSKEAILKAANVRESAETLASDVFDTAAKAVANYISEGGAANDWTAEKASGLYKGNDVIEAGLATVRAIKIIEKEMPAAKMQFGASSILSGLNNSKVDVGILALRESMMVALDAKTANMVGLKGGANGDIYVEKDQLFDPEVAEMAELTTSSGYDHGEIYPFIVKNDGTSIDKDAVLSQSAARTDRRQTTAYLAAAIPAPSSSLFRLKQLDKSTMKLVKCDANDTPVTYAECITLLGFGSAPAGKAASDEVEYKIITNIDTQNHVGKGIFGVRLDRVNSFSVERITMFDHTTHEARQVPTLIGEEQTQVAIGTNYAHEPENQILYVRGVSINGCTDGEVSDIFLKDVKARQKAIAVEIRGESSSVSVKNVKGLDLRSFENEVVGVRVAQGCTEITVEDVQLEKSEAANDGKIKPLEILSQDVKIK